MRDKNQIPLFRGVPKVDLFFILGSLVALLIAMATPKTKWHLDADSVTHRPKIKGRLGLENFTGKTVEAVKQDFWSTIFISNLETIMTEKTEEKMNAEKPVENKQVKINKAVSFNAEL